MNEQEEEYEEKDLAEKDENKSKESVGSDEENEGPIYNPKNLPLGWDGKPIRKYLYISVLVV